MDESRRDVSVQVPHLRAMEMCVIAARCGSFSGAARALRLTQGAVSRQVQRLESTLGVALFVRQAAGLKLTAQGEVFLPIVEEALARLATACRVLRTPTRGISLRMPPTVASRWFLPLLPALRTVLPEVDIRITTDLSYEPHFEDNDDDAAIVLGRGDWPDLEVHRLMSERLTVVCSAAAAAGLGQPASLEGAFLLNCYPDAAWAAWSQGARVNCGPLPRGQDFPTLELGLTAAVRGEGVTLADVTLARDALRDRLLVAPFDHQLDRGLAYFLVYPQRRARSPILPRLCDWLVQCAGPGTE